MEEEKQDKEIETQTVTCKFSFDQKVRIKDLDIIGFVYKLVVEPSLRIEYNVVYFYGGCRKSDWFTERELESTETNTKTTRVVGL